MLRSRNHQRKCSEVELLRSRMLPATASRVAFICYRCHRFTLSALSVQDATCLTVSNCYQCHLKPLRMLSRSPLPRSTGTCYHGRNMTTASNPPSPFLQWLLSRFQECCLYTALTCDAASNGSLQKDTSTHCSHVYMVNAVTASRMSTPPLPFLHCCHCRCRMLPLPHLCWRWWLAHFNSHRWFA